MGRRLRYYKSDGVYFITNRCAKGRFLLTPGPEINDAVETLLGRYTTCTDVELFAWVFMGNHFHLMARSENKRIPDFMRDFQSELSKRVQDIRDGWDESVFPDRYNAQPVLDDAMIREKLLYIWMNPVRAGLVHKPADWPGVSSFELQNSGESREVEYLDRKKLRRLRRNADNPEAIDPAEAKISYELEVTNPPALQDRSVAEAGCDLQKDLDDRCQNWAEVHRVGGDEFAGADRVRAQEPLERPNELPEIPEPLCLTSCDEERDEYRNQYANVVNKYRRAMQKWRSGDLTELEFPPGTFPPGWLRVADGSPICGSDADDGDDSEVGNQPEQGGAPDTGAQSGPDGPRGDPEPPDRAA